MQQPSGNPYQYGASTNPSTLPASTKNPPLFNPTELKQNLVNGESSFSHLSQQPGDSQHLSSQYGTGHATSSSNSQPGDNRYSSSFSNTPGHSTLSSVPLNGLYEQNSAFTTVTSSYNNQTGTNSNNAWSSGRSSNEVQSTIGSNATQNTFSTVGPVGTNATQNPFSPIGPIGTNSTQNQFSTTPGSNVMKPSPVNQSEKPPGTSSAGGQKAFNSGGQYPLTNGSQVSSANPLGTEAQSEQASGGPGKPFQPSLSNYQPLPSRGNPVQPPLSSASSSFPFTMSTHGTPSEASASFRQQSVSSSSYQQQSTTSSSVTQPLVSSKQGHSSLPPVSTSAYYAQQPSTSVMQQPRVQSSASVIQQPQMQPLVNVMPQLQVSSNSLQFSAPTSSNPPAAPSGHPQSTTSKPPPVSNSFVQQPPTAANVLRPPASSNSFQAPSVPIATTVPRYQNTQQNAPDCQQNFRMPPNPYATSNRTPLNNGIPPLPSMTQYQQPSSNIPPLPNSQISSHLQSSAPANAYNNYQVPPRVQQPGSYNSMLAPKQAGYPSSNYMPQQTAAAGYPQTQQGLAAGYPQALDSQFSNLSVSQGLNKMWGYEPHDLLNTRDILPSSKVEPPPIRLPQNLPETINCSRDLFRCTLTKIPESKSILDKSRLPLGLLLHPFKDINNLKVIKNMIVRCRQCRTYINPFVQFLDSKQWKCNICFRTNEIHEQFLYDRNTEIFGDPYRRPEIQSATVEYLATSDYTVRDPPQPAMYLFLLDVSQIAAQSGYLYTVCEVLLNQLKAMPGDLRTSVAIITYDSAVHFYSLAEGQTQPSQMVLTDIDDIFLPSPENIIVNLKECYDMIVDLLKQLPEKFKDSLDSGSALGPALQAAFKLLQPTGGRITIFQTCLPNKGPGALESRENPNQRSNDEPLHMNPATDFYKKIALECTSFYIAVDLFILNSQYVDLATLSGVSKFSSGCIHHIPLYNGKNMSHVYQLDRMFSRYLTRKIGFESVMRIRCTKGMSIHTFHGNFFVRSTDLLALPNVNPDAGYGIQISIDENLTHIQHACFQVAVLYTSSKGDRRIRVHTLCLPVVSNVNDVLAGADQQCIAGLLAKMAVDRSLQHSLSDAREAFLNVVTDVLSTYKLTQSGHLTGSLLAPSSLKLLPLYILALLKHPAFRIGQSTRLDDRVFAMTEMKCLPLNSLMLSIYPELYPIHTLESDPTVEWNDLQVPVPRILQLSAERLQATGTYLLNLPDVILILIRHGTSPAICSGMFGFQSVAQMPETLYELPQLETQLSLRLNSLVGYLNDDKAFVSPVKIIKDSSTDRMEFYDKLIEDKNGGGMSYYEFLQRIREQVKSY